MKFALIAILLLSGCDQKPEKPDVILIVVDTLRSDHMSLYGHNRQTTPTLDSLADEALVYDRMIAHSGWTLPSMASILTARYPADHGATRDPKDPLRFSRVNPDIPMIQEAFAKSGYRTAAFVNNVYMAPEFGLNRGFDLYDYVGASGNEERSAKKTVETALDWIDNSKQPAFVFLHFMEPHLPYFPPEETRRAFTGPGEIPVPTPFGTLEVLNAIAQGWKPDSKQLDYIQKMYDEEILAADQATNYLIEGLKQRDRWENAIFAFTGDHGEEFWDHGGFEHGHTLYGELLRVPLLLKAPGIKANRIQDQVQHVDMSTTLLALAGITPLEGGEGRDLRDLGEHKDALSEDCLYGPPRIAVTASDKKLILNLDSRVVNIYNVNSKGQNDEIITEQETLDALAKPLVTKLDFLRGDHKMRTSKNETAPLNREAIEALRSLGYIE